MKNKLIFILWLLMFSFFSCDFGIKENEETNSKEYFTVKGSCSIQGAIPSDLLPEKSIKQNAQRTVVPKIETDVITVIFESETKETKTAEVVNNDGVLNFEVELPAGKWTVKAQGEKSDVVIIKSESCQIELSAENKSENVALVLKPTQSDTGKGFFEFSFGQIHTKVSGINYTYKKNGSTESQSVIIDNFTAKENIKLSSGVYTFRFDFYSDMDCTDELLYSFTEVVNIFDGLTTDTWISAGEYIKEGEICINNDMINQFVSTTVYVSEFGNDSNFGTFFAPVTTIQEAVDKVIAMHKVTASSEGNPYKILLLSDIYTSSNNSFENNNNAFVNIDPSSASETPLYLTISKYGDGNATINANRSSSNTGRVMYIGENANVTLQNLILTGGYLLGENGGGIYSKGNCDLNSCIISGNTAKAPSGSVSGGGVYIESGSFTMEGCTISGNTAGYETDTPNAYGGGIFGASGTNITMNDTTISENKVASVNGVEGAGVCLSGAELTMKGGSISENKCSSDTSSYGGGVYINNSSKFTMTSGVISENSAKYGGGISVSGGKFIMNGGSISSNTADNNGHGVYVVKNNSIDPLFEILGEACIEDNNDVYLTEDQKITITGELSSGSVATITPENYAEDVDVPVLATGNGITLSEEVRRKFNVTKYRNNVETTITDTGFLKNTLTLGENPELTEDLYKICSTINVSSAEGMNALSTLSPPEDAENPGKTFEGKTIILKDNVVLNDEYKPIHTFSGVFDGGGYSIKNLMASENYAWDSPKGKALFYVVKGENAEIKNLKVEGTAEGAGIAYTLTEKAKISNCKSYVNITTNGEGYPTPGGIVSNLNNGSIIENCENRGTIICNKKNTGGGIVGSMSFYTRDGEENCRDYTVIANCTNYGEVTINDVTGVVKMGGICGEFTFGTIFNCANEGEVTVTTENNCIQDLGGIVGYCRGSEIDGIINCYNSGEIYSSSSNSADQKIGGIVGKGYVGLFNNVYYTIRVTNIVNNDDKTFSIGHIESYDGSAAPDITNNFYKKSGESTYDVNNIDFVVNTLNDYSDETGRQYLEWGKNNGNIIFSKEISDNQEITP